MFYSTVDIFSESHGILSGSSGTDVVLVFINVILPVAASFDIRDVVDAGTDGSLIDLSRQLNASFIWVATWINLLQAT